MINLSTINQSYKEIKMSTKFKCIKPQHSIAKFLRNKDRSPCGLVVATKSKSGQVTMGWSFTSKADKFDRERAWSIALTRVETGSSASVPRAMLPIMIEVGERAARYFKVDQNDVVINQRDC